MKLFNRVVNSFAYHLFWIVWSVIWLFIGASNRDLFQVILYAAFVVFWVVITYSRFKFELRVAWSDPVGWLRGIYHQAYMVKAPDGTYWVKWPPRATRPSAGTHMTFNLDDDTKLKVVVLEVDREIVHLALEKSDDEMAV